MRIVSINSKKQQEFGMLEFYHLRKGESPKVKQIEEVLDFLREQRVSVTLKDYLSGQRVLDSTPYQETLLYKVLESLGANPRFVRKNINDDLLPEKAPDVILPTSALTDLASNPLQALKNFFDIMG